MRNKIIILGLTIVFLIISVVLPISFAQKNQEMPFYVEVYNKNQKEVIRSWKNENNECYVFLPSFADLSETFLFLNTDNSVFIDEKKIHNNMSCKNLKLDTEYTLKYSFFGENVETSVKFKKSANVPTLHIETESGNMDYIHLKKGNKESANIKLYTTEGELSYSGKAESISGRGNSTWVDYSKKPYNVKLLKEDNLLDIGKAQNWVLLANAIDSTNIRNKAVYDFSNKIGLEYSPSSEWVDLYLNGEYAGLYLLCEKNEVHPNRVNISENNSFLVSLELEDRLTSQNLPHIITNSKQALRIHYPQNVSEESAANLLKTWQELENAILSENGTDNATNRKFTDIIDIDSWAKKYLIEEIFGNYDACFMSQFFYHNSEDASQKIFAGPVWDFDYSMGNPLSWQLSNPRIWLANRLKVRDGNDSPWFYHLCQKEEFAERVTEIFVSDFKPQLTELLDNSLEEYASIISKASENNKIRWFDSETTDNVQYIKDYLSKRIDFLNDVWCENGRYNTVLANGQMVGYYANLAVPHGECLQNLPDLENKESLNFKGWYYKETNEPFDINKPITEDIEIYAKWEERQQNRFGDVMKLLPIAVIAVLFVGLVIFEFKRSRNGGGGVWQKKIK